jgi:hypothetical protein
VVDPALKPDAGGRCGGVLCGFVHGSQTAEADSAAWRSGGNRARLPRRLILSSGGWLIGHRVQCTSAGSASFAERLAPFAPTPLADETEHRLRG